MLAIVFALLADTTQSLQIPVARAESIHVELSGSGTPVAIIPGLFGSAFGFRTLVPMLNEAGYETIVVEPLGIGSSGRPARADYSLTAQADRVAAALDSLHLRRVIVIAHSIGGSEAFRLAYRRPDLVRGVVSVEGGPTETATTPAFRRAMRLAPWIKIFGGIKLVRWKIRKLLVASSGDPGWVTDEVVLGYTAAAARDLNGTLKAFIAMSNARERDKLRPHLGEIRCPVILVIGGAPHDGDVGADEVPLLARSLPSFGADTVAGAGHFIYEERPGAVLAALKQLVATLPALPALPRGAR